jgi:NAD(P)-dependent dehydrogenase (short-subunit alcohol dehydrogenase family)
MINPMSLVGRSVLVTGASGGIGQAVAILLSQLGARLVITGRNAEKLNKTRSTLQGTGHAIESFELEATHEIGDWLQDVARRHFTLDGLVHAAGTQLLAPLQTTDVSHLRDLLSINTEAGFALAKAFRHRKVYSGQKGSVVFVTSIMGEVGASGRAAYSLSKGAIHALTRSLAVELAPQKIRVNSVAPAAVRSEMFDSAAAVWSEEQLHAVEKLHPLGIGEPSDVANAVAFLLADSSRWITGTIMTVDGGYSAC